MSAPLAAIVARLLRKDPAERFGSAAELASALAPLETAPRGVAACDAPTEGGSGRVAPHRAVERPVPRTRPHSRGRVRRRAETAWRIARGATTGVAMAIVVITGVRVVSEHHVTVNGLRHLTLRHAAHTALVELGLRQRTNPAAPSDSLATVESDSGSAPPGN
jgi:hypothetical protein